MFRKSVPTLLTTFGLALALCGTSLPSSAQQAAAPPANPLANLTIPPSLFFGFLGPMSGIVDPTHSAAMTLLQRSDVQNEVGIDLNQISAIKNLQAKSQQEFRDKMTTSIQDTSKNFQNLAPDQIQSQLQETLAQFATSMQTFNGDLDKRTEAILRAKQITRLHELDLQWRGPLAFSDPKIADILTLTPEQRAKATSSLRDFTDIEQKALMQAMIPTPTPKDTPSQPPVNPMVQMQKKMAVALHTKEIEKAKTETEAKLLEMLTPAQKDQWKTLQGTKYTFHKLDQ